MGHRKIKKFTEKRASIINGSSAGFQSARGRIRRGEPELSGMASSPPAGRTRPVASLPISQTGCPLDESGSRLRPAAAGLRRAKGCLSYGNL